MRNHNRIWQQLIIKLCVTRQVFLKEIQFLIQMGLDTNKIVSILDNDKNKQGKRLYGSNLFVESPKILENVVSPHIILKAGVYDNEIKSDILENINTTAIFL